MSPNTTFLQHDLFGGAPEPIKRDRRPVADKLRASARADMIRVAPDVHAWVPADKDEGAPKFCLCRWTRNTDGAYRPVPFASRLVRVTSELMACLGFTDGSRRRRYETLMRLGRAGFVDLIHASPGCWLLDLDSWFRHLAACADDPERWDAGSDDRDTYLRLNGLGGWRRTVGR